MEKLPHEERHVFAVDVTLFWAITFINENGCAHLVRQFVPHDTKPGRYWMICKADSWLRKKFDDIAAVGDGFIE